MPRPKSETDPALRREEILMAAFTVFVEKGFHRTTMLDVARRAKASKETLYAWFGSKEKLLAALVAWRADHLAVSTPPSGGNGVPDIQTALTRFGTTLLTLLMLPEMIAVHRIVIAEVARDPTLGEAFDRAVRARVQRDFIHLLRDAQTRGQLAFEEAAEAADVFVGLLRGELQIQVLLGLRPPPDEAAIAARAAWTTGKFLDLFGPAR